MPNSYVKQSSTNQYFKFEKDNKNNVIKKNLTGQQKRNLTAGSVMTMQSKSRNVFDRLSKPVQAAGIYPNRDAYMPPIKNIQRVYNATVMPRVVTRLTPLQNHNTPASFAAAASKIVAAEAARAVSSAAAAALSSHRTQSPRCEVSPRSIISARPGHQSARHLNTARAYAPTNKELQAARKALLPQVQVTAARDVAADHNDAVPCIIPQLATSRSMSGHSSTSINRVPINSPISRSQSSSPQRSTQQKVEIGLKPSSTLTNITINTNSSYESANLICSLDSIESKDIAHSVEEILNSTNMQLTPQELNLLKNVLKTDQHAPALGNNNNTQLFKEVLKTQLEKIVNQENIVKHALTNLEQLDYKECASIIRQLSHDCNEQVLNDVGSLSTVLDLPVHEKELLLLQTLGKRLAERLHQYDLETKSATTSINKCEMKSASTSIHKYEMKSAATSIHKYEMKSASTSMTNLKPIMQRFFHSVVYKPVPQYIESVALWKGLKFQYGFAQEYEFAVRSLFDLKQHAYEQFYISDHCELKCTSFAELQQQPDLLMRYLRPKHPEGLSFNLLEHDRSIFHSYFFRTDEALQLQQKCVLQWQKQQVAEEQLIKEQLNNATKDDSVPLLGDCNSMLGTPRSEEITAPALATLPQKTDPVDVKTAIADAHSRHRHRLRRTCTPLPIDLPSTIQAKNQLLKTVLVGSVQLSLFLVLIMAFTFPEISC